MKNVSVIQTSGGKGTRNRPLNLYTPTSMIPKGLMRIMGLPIAELQLEQVRSIGINDVHIITQHLENREYLSSRFSDGKRRFGLNIRYSHPMEDWSNNGSGDAILTYAENADLKGDAIILSNDNLYEFNMERALEAHRDLGALITILTTQIRPRDTIGMYGLVKPRPGSDHQVSVLAEKPENEAKLLELLEMDDPSKLSGMRVHTNTAAYIMNTDEIRKIIGEDWIEKGRKGDVDFDMAGSLLDGLIQRGYPIHYRPIDRWGDFGSRELYLDTFPLALSGSFPSVFKVLENRGYERLDDNVWVHPETLEIKDNNGRSLKQRIQKGRVKLGPNVFIGRDVNIEDGAEIRFSDVEKYGMISEEAYLNHVYLSPYGFVGPNAYLRSAAFGHQVKIESSFENPVHIDSRSIVGSEVIVPEGSALEGTIVFPGYEFKRPMVVSGKKLYPTQATMRKIVEGYK